MCVCVGHFECRNENEIHVQVKNTVARIWIKNNAEKNGTQLKQTNKQNENKEK